MNASAPRRLLFTAVALALAAMLWLPLVHLVFRPSIGEYRVANGVPPMAASLLRSQLAAQSNADSRSHLRASNPEWELMTRTFTTLALANLSLRNPEQKADYLRRIDALIDDTLRDEARNDHFYFLLPYARGTPWVERPARSQFVDSELLMMIAARRMLAENQQYRADATRRMPLMIARMRKSPVLCAESYPDECWLFDNTMALAAIRLMDLLDRTDHSRFLQDAVAAAKQRLLDPKSGLLFSSFSAAGQPKDGPEGSSIWVAAHFLQLVDPDFAADQYRRARSELGESILGFGYAREWPNSAPTRTDIDSGAVIPFIGASPSSSGLACVASAAFADEDLRRQLNTTLFFAAFPIRDGNTLRFAASNQLGDAVLLYSTVLGPLWELAKVGRKP